MNVRQGQMTTSIMSQKCGLYLKEATPEELEFIKTILAERKDAKRAHKVFDFLIKQANPQPDYQRLFHGAIDKITSNNGNPELEALIHELQARADAKIKGQTISTYAEGNKPNSEELAEEINKTVSEGDGKLYWPIQLPNEDEPRVFEYVEVEPDEIDEKTEIVDVHNSRFQGQVKRVEHLASLIKKVGQSQPAFAYLPEGKEKASVLDGSRRRMGCKIAKRKFRMFVTTEDLTDEQIEFLAEIFESQDKLSYPESATRFANRYFAAKEKKDGKLSVNEYAKTQTKYGKSHAYNYVDHGCVDPNFYNDFPKLEFCTQNWCQTKLMPLLKRIMESDLLPHEESKAEAIGATSRYVAELISKYKAKLSDDSSEWEDGFHNSALKYVESELFSSEPKSVKERTTPKYDFVVGKNTKSKNFVRQSKITEGEPYHATVKLDNPEHQAKFAKFLETFIEENGLNK
ncbi:ParB N-terminal domain-containing protein [Vibrio sp. D431a]|uniref:ParB N-terminal domain-containing protein n=1 Tax=Vibrio sp. D431a TaxID=2837388 RepID=UPI0025533BBE|nr:ParB N-terminal domain-containing protein [Vibrio sp. D431a]MDK9790088.1 ParB N-terminal domain-containing protein [Vibrio sp. D431a]